MEQTFRSVEEFSLSLVIAHCVLKMLNVKCNNDYSVQNDESLREHCTNERRVRKRGKNARRDVI